MDVEVGIVILADFTTPYCTGTLWFDLKLKLTLDMCQRLQSFTRPDQKPDQDQTFSST